MVRYLVLRQVDRKEEKRIEYINEGLGHMGIGQSFMVDGIIHNGRLVIVNFMSTIE